MATSMILLSLCLQIFRYSDIQPEPFIGRFSESLAQFGLAYTRKEKCFSDNEVESTAFTILTCECIDPGKYANHRVVAVLLA